MSTTLSSPSEFMTQKQTAAWFAAPPASQSDGTLPEWYVSLQKQAWQRFLELPEPTRKNEEWRFADLKKVRFTELVPASPADDSESLVKRAKESRVDAFAAHFVFANNRLVHAETDGLPEGALCLPINEALAKHGDLVREHFLQEKADLGGKKFAALHASATLSGLFVHFPENCVCENPVVVHHFSGGDMAATFPHTLVVAKDNASVSVMETFESIAEGEQSLAVGMVDLDAVNGARIQYVALQNASESGAKHVQLNSTRVGRDSSVKSACINLGAAWVRNESINRMVETGADSRILSANLASGIQEYDQRTLQSHEAQHTTSDLLFKNALYGDSRTIFAGLIDVHPGAHHTDSFQTCRNLLGSDTAEANAMPGLEINADQVKCSHGSTSGQISDEEIFYLQARGIPAETARRMISLGFLNESIQKLDGEELKENLFEQVKRKFTSL
ncbi:MAG: Fe-S cluster assembly protein SufD [Verrucomicrobiales bacterium]